MSKNIFNWSEIGDNPYKFAENASIKNLELCINKATEHYHNNTPVISDDQYDILVEYLEKINPNSKELQNVGAIVTKEKTKLPTFLPSMDKMKADTNALSKWILEFNGPYIKSDKLDGMSLLIDARNGQISAYTRGNGEVGGKINLDNTFLKMATENKLIISNMK